MASYTVTNTGTWTVTQHTLMDNQLGTILSNFPYALAPGASVFITATINLPATTVTSATWTSSNPGPLDVVAASDTVAVNIGPLFGCNAPPRTFETGLPGSWSVVDLSPAQAGIDWTTSADAACSLGNATNGSGVAACADSDAAGEGAPQYDTTLVSNAFDLSGVNWATLRLSAFYSDLGVGNDLFRIDVWNGSAWVNELTWDEEHSNEDIALDLSAYAGQAAAQVRFRYSGDGWDWYAQVDDVRLACGSRVYLPLTRK